ncbi:ThuA domain-containing protein [Rubripirellula amarantea]|nr:ThuA domain-containing protein [Rubripirellula amarantea]
MNPLPALNSGPNTGLNAASTLTAFLAAALFSLGFISVAQADQPKDQSLPLRVLLVAGGCCHDYSTQSQLLKEGIEARIHADVTVILSSNKSTKTTFEIYESDEWADGYDVVIHDECSADVTAKPYVDRILKAHRSGTPAVNLHCAMHSYRWGDFRSPVDPGVDNAAWYEMIGVQSTAHGPKSPIDIIHSNSSHPITQGLGDWTTVDEELYNNLRVFSDTTALTKGNQMTQPNKRDLKKDPQAKARESTSVVAWTNEYGPNKTKIFSTSLGHQNETVADQRYLNLVVRGLLWTTGNLSETGVPSAHLAK